MFRSLWILITISILISACTPVHQTTPQPDQPTTTSSPLPTATPTRTSLPSATPTASITPLPTIPTFTPTFDVSTIVTVTPAPKAECPIAKPAENLNFNFLNLIPGIDIENRDNAEENMLIFLDTYGAEPLIKYLRSEWTNEWRYEGQNFLYKDLTNDGTPELVIGLTSFYIFSCTDGRYKKIFELPPDGHGIAPQILFSKDNNRNGLLELTILIGTWTGEGRAYQIYEWDGEQFRNLVLSDNPNFPDLSEIWVEASGKIFYQDMNNDTVNELIRDSGIMSWLTYSDALPWRNKRTYYQWNEKNYAPMHHEFTIPEFRFQAIQDGDLAVSQFEFTKALSLYQGAIFSDKLKYYSVDIRENLQINWIRQFEMSQSGNISPTPTPYPNDLTEYPRLAAYAYYRIMLLHLVQGNESDATTVYNTLQEKFGNDPYGQPYVEMATAFWNAYQSTHKMYAGCAAAIEYAAAQPDILIPLGSDYHGWQSHIYKPEDVCPFR